VKEAAGRRVYCIRAHVLPKIWRYINREMMLCWTYCYDGRYIKGTWDVEEFYSHFSDIIVGALANESNCDQDDGAVAPVVVVQQAAFLLGTTTAFISGTESSSPTVPKTSETKQQASSSLVDHSSSSTVSSKIRASESTIIQSTASSEKDQSTSEPENDGPSTSGQRLSEPKEASNAGGQSTSQEDNVTQISSEPTVTSNASGGSASQENTVNCPTPSTATRPTSTAIGNTATNEPQHASQSQLPRSTGSGQGPFDTLISLINVAV
jgi:hypothetical protein